MALLPAPAPATVAEQRARLPPPAECHDPVAGTWMAHVYYRHVGEWYVFLLRVKHAPGGGPDLVGTIHSEFWAGGPKDAEPPACEIGVVHRSVAEHARGHFDGKTLVFNATDWRPDQPSCLGSEVDYLLDDFSGRIDRSRQEFQSVLNSDAPEWVNVPTVFRRVSCDSGTVVAGAGDRPPRPPGPPPRRHLFGCGCL